MTDREDRRFRFECCRAKGSMYVYPAMITCWPANYENGWDGKLDNRQSSRHLCGQYSYHSNYREDRSFKWQKCRVASGIFIDRTINLQQSSWDNEFEVTC